MKRKNLRQVERLLIGLAVADCVLFAAGYFGGMLFFYAFLLCTALLIAVWAVFWRCPHCGRQLWWNFDLPCKKCGGDIYKPPAPKPKNTQERTGFLHW